MLRRAKPSGRNFEQAHKCGQKGPDIESAARPFFPHSHAIRRSAVTVAKLVEWRDSGTEVDRGDIAYLTSWTGQLLAAASVIL